MNHNRIKIPVAIIACILGLYALAEMAGYGIRGLFPGKKEGRQPLLTCSMDFADENKTRKTLSAKHNPDIVIRNQGTRKAVSVTWKARVYRYDIVKQAITAFAIQDPQKLGQADLHKELQPTEALRQATLGLPGDDIVAAYFVSVEYRTEAGKAPSQLNAAFFVVHQTIYDETQFQADRRYDSIMQAIRAFNQSSAPQPSESKKKSLSTAVVRKPPFSIQVYGVYRSGGSGALLPITNGTEMNSGDHYKIYFRSNRDCYAYIYQIDAQGAIFQLFPLHQFDGVALNQANPVVAGVNYMLPNRNRYFYLDDTTGAETLYFATYLHRNEELEAKYAALQQALRSNVGSQISRAEKMLAAYLKGGKVEKEVQMIISPVSWKSEQSPAPVLGYHIQDIGEAGIHTIDFIHR